MLMLSEDKNSWKRPTGHYIQLSYFAGICTAHGHDGACNVWRRKNTTTLRENATPFSNVDTREDDHKGKSQYFSHVFALPHYLALTYIEGHPARCDRRAGVRGATPALSLSWPSFSHSSFQRSRNQSSSDFAVTRSPRGVCLLVGLLLSLGNGPYSLRSGLMRVA